MTDAGSERSPWVMTPEVRGSLHRHGDDWVVEALQLEWTGSVQRSHLQKYK